MAWPFRDRFFLDPGHMSAMLYSILGLCGKYSIDELKQFRQWGSDLPGHPELDVARGVENTSGPLGIGHAMGLGTAIAERFLAARFGEWMAHKTYLFISDGGIQEEISQGVGRIAGHLGLGNYIMFFDSNDIQLSHPTSVASSEDTAAKYEAWGWHVQTINGNDADEIRTALRNANDENKRPSIIIGKTIMGKGAVTESGESFEGEYSTHGQPISKAGASFEKTVENLGGDPQNPFVIFPEVAEGYKAVLEEKRKGAQEAKTEQIKWEGENSELASQLNRMLNNDPVKIDFSAIEMKKDIATRSASGLVLAEFAEKIDNMIVSSADLCNSDNTLKFLNKTTEFKRGDFSGAFLQVGVAELTMAAIMNGIALHGGVIPVCGTFFVFSDYMKPAVRLAALMSLPVKYVWTHDSFRVGEDGPTHEPVEQEAQIRLLEKMNNFNGERSMLVLRPADVDETKIAWKIAIANDKSPTALILTRQNVPNLPAKAGSTRFDDSLQAYKGAYIIYQSSDDKPDIILVGNGSDVSLLLSAGKILENEKGLNIRVVSAISEGLFRDQSREYQQEVLPFGIPTFGISSGVSDALAGLVGPMGKAVGFQRFGASAPYKVLEEKFGFTPESVVEKMEQYLNEYKDMLEILKSE
jgi:transketolase